MDKKLLKVLKGQYSELHAEGRKALFQFAMTGDQTKLDKVIEVSKRLERRAAFSLVRNKPTQKQRSAP